MFGSAKMKYVTGLARKKSNKDEQTISSLSVLCYYYSAESIIFPMSRLSMYLDVVSWEVWLIFWIAKAIIALLSFKLTRYLKLSSGMLIATCLSIVFDAWGFYLLPTHTTYHLFLNILRDYRSFWLITLFTLSVSMKQTNQKSSDSADVTHCEGTTEIGTSGIYYFFQYFIIKYLVEMISPIWSVIEFHSAGFITLKQFDSQLPNIIIWLRLSLAILSIFVQLLYLNKIDLTNSHRINRFSKEYQMTYKNFIISKSKLLRLGIFLYAICISLGDTSICKLAFAEVLFHNEGRLAYSLAESIGGIVGMIYTMYSILKDKNDNEPSRISLRILKGTFVSLGLMLLVLLLFSVSTKYRHVDRDNVPEQLKVYAKGYEPQWVNRLNIYSNFEVNHLNGCTILDRINLDKGEYYYGCSKTNPEDCLDNAYMCNPVGSSGKLALGFLAVIRVPDILDDSKYVSLSPSASAWETLILGFLNGFTGIHLKTLLFSMIAASCVSCKRMAAVGETAFHLLLNMDPLVTL